ncbi:MAG: hypothetical protein ACLS9T_04380 [Streptococcus salivarius]
MLFVDGDDFWNNHEFFNELSSNIKKYSSDVVIFSYDKYYGDEELFEVNFSNVGGSRGIR